MCFTQPSTGSTTGRILQLLSANSLPPLQFVRPFKEDLVVIQTQMTRYKMNVGQTIFRKKMYDFHFMSRLWSLW